MLNYPQVYNLRSLALEANISSQRSARGPLVHSCSSTEYAKLKTAEGLLCFSKCHFPVYLILL